MPATRTFDAANALVRTLVIPNRRGLHARASAKFVELAASYDACVQVEKDGVAVGGTSIMGLMLLAAASGSTIRVSASGRQARQALDALEKLVKNGFGEEC
ncbi:MAG: Phosphocarrier, HPr family [Candidatus Tokpelaia hoelldobleri]|uniref:Phosphocarrier, HPr family n=1 Tax=Candidatus Tokpelaia hoelldobleri TaxID=1902579 RepID=A0A1U9JSM9_9HYPH|nr:MAG: Phosphocarrier, HPr family [Candidatus Tokpelaia hoelldoblerii]